MQNRDVAHRFFYDSIDSSFERRSMSVWYSRGKYYSYSTCIGEMSKDINGNNVFIISDNNFSMTTAKHLGELRHACPYSVVDIYYLPQSQGNREFYVNETINHLKNNLEWYSKAKLTQKPNREGFTNTYNMLDSTLNLEKFKSEFKNIKKILKSYKSLYNAINDPEKLKQLKELQIKREKQQQVKLKRELNKVLNKYDYLTILKNIYTYNNSIFESELKDKLRKYFNPKNDLSFVWFDDNLVRTSQGIRVDRGEAETLLKLWQHNKLRHGMTISCYTVLEVMENYVKIGCHKIPVENLQALAKELETQKEAA